MNILFIYSLDDTQSISKPLRSWTSIQFGISYISSVLKNHGYQTDLLVLGRNKWNESKQLVDKSLEKFNPDLICCTAIFSQYSFIEGIARYIKDQCPDKFIIIGGVHATLKPDEVINGPFDALCIGEGEYPTLELCKQLAGEQEPHGISNLWIKSPDGNIEKNLPRDFIQDLDSLPFPDREIWKSWMKTQYNDEFALLLGRGCPYNCTYCSNHALREIAQGKYTRIRSPENVLKEIAYLYNNFPIQSLYLEVETIAVNKKWTIELCAQLEAFNLTIEEPLSYSCNFRISPQSIDEELFIAFKKANFNRINIGLESGSERIRREVLKRNYSNKDFLKVVSIARKNKLSIHVYNMIGLPGESLNDHMETVKLNRLSQPDGHFTGIFFPYPGTELYDLSLAQGLLNGPIETQMERSRSIIELPDFSKAQIQRAYTWFHFRVYKGYKPLWEILIHVIITKIRSNPTTNMFFRQLVQLPVLRQLRARFARK